MVRDAMWACTLGIRTTCDERQHDHEHGEKGPRRKHEDRRSRALRLYPLEIKKNVTEKKCNVGVDDHREEM